MCCVLCSVVKKHLKEEKKKNEKIDWFSIMNDNVGTWVKGDSHFIFDLLFFYIQFVWWAQMWTTVHFFLEGRGRFISSLLFKFKTLIWWFVLYHWFFFFFLFFFNFLGGCYHTVPWHTHWGGDWIQLNIFYFYTFSF